MTEEPTKRPQAVGARDISPEAIRGRMTQFCQRFGVEPVKLKVRMGKVYMTEDLVTWCAIHGVSLDWVLLGDPMCMAAAYRKQEMSVREFASVLEGLDVEEKKHLLACMKASTEGGVPIEDALSDFSAFCDRHRAGVGGAPATA